MACSTPATRLSSTPVPATTPAIEVPRIERPGGESAQWWFRSGAAAAAGRGAMQGRARNVILFVGDGMSTATVAAARILAGQRAGGPGEEHQLSWERFPHTAFARTYNTDMQTPDSAGTMTAIATGVKTRMGVIGLDQTRARGDCTGLDGRALLDVRSLAEAAGMATGIVTTTRITHATPAVLYAHSPERDWEDDSNVPAAALEGGCSDIAAQLVDRSSGNGPDVIFGGGRRHFLGTGQPDPEYPGRTGLRRDGRDLIRDWQRRHPGGAFVWNRTQLQAARDRTPVLGLFGHGHLHFDHDRPGADPDEPGLAELTGEAIRRLQGAGAGYFLLVEGGRIDHAHHDGNAYRALTETIALAEAVQTAVDMTDAADTLILVTADHSHTMTFAGYPARGNPILDKVHTRAPDGTRVPTHDAMGLPYTTLAYANGPGFRRDDPVRPDLGSVDTRDPDFLQEATVPLESETHGGEDVGVWARGPGAHAVRGSMEQNVLFHLMVQATPRLRNRLCQEDLCNPDGVPVDLPDPSRFHSVPANAP